MHRLRGSRIGSQRNFEELNWPWLREYPTDNSLRVRQRLEAKELCARKPITSEQSKLPVMGTDIDNRSEVLLKRHVLVLNCSRNMQPQRAAEPGCPN